MSNTDGSDLVVDIEKLALNNNFYDWFITTNKLIDAVNPLNIYDITARKGLTESRANGHVILDVDSGKGIKTFPDDGTGKVTLDFESLTEKASPSNDDLFVIEQPATGNSNNVYKIFATNMLPPILTGNHIFTGTITVAALNVNDNVIRLQYGDATTENDSGLILDTTTSSKVKFTYDNAIQAWFSNKNLGLNSGYSFVTNSGERRANFKFGTYGSNQFDTGLELMMGQNSTQGDDKSFIIEGRNSSKSFEFIYKDYTNTDTETTLFYSQVETVNPVTSTFKVMDKIQIGNVSGSIDFKNDTSLTTLGRSAYEANRIPISNSDGILDNKWTNRYVTTQHSGIAVGNIVKLYDDTNNQATVVKSALTSSSSEEEAYSLGIVERLSGGKAYIVTHGQFDGLSGLLPGSVYYLTTGSPNYTTTKPTSGIVKPVFIATSTTGGIFFPMSAQGLSFGRATVSAGAGGTASGSAPVADAPTDTLNFVAGAGINLVANPASTSIQISAATAGNQPTYSSIATDSGTVAAFTPNETLLMTGDGGGIEVIADNKVDTNGDKLTIKGRYFRTVSWSGDSSTNDIPGSKTASYDDTLSIFAGTGIGISQHGSGFRIDATGVAASSILPNSQPLSILFNSASTDSDSIIGYFAPHPSQVRKLTSTTNSILSSSTSNAIEWQTPTTFLQQKIAATELTKFKFTTGSVNNSGAQIPNTIFYGTTFHNHAFDAATNNNTSFRNFGLVAIPKNSSNVNWLLPTNITGFRYNTLNNINSSLVGLMEGDGITLTTNNHVDNVISNIPNIKISSKYGSAFNQIKILDTSETIISKPSQTRTVTNYIAYSDDLATSFASNGAGRDTVFPAAPNGNDRSAHYGSFAFGDTKSFTSITDTGPFGSTVTMSSYVNNMTGTTGTGFYTGIPRELWEHNKTITYSVYVKRAAGATGNMKFRIYYWDIANTSNANNGTIWASTEEITPTTSWQRVKLTFTLFSQARISDGVRDFDIYPSGGGTISTNNSGSRYLRTPGQIVFFGDGSPGTRRYGSSISPHVTVSICEGSANFDTNGETNAKLLFYGAQLEQGSEATTYVSSGAFGTGGSSASNFNWIPNPSNVGTFNPNNSWTYNFATATYVIPESHGTLTISTANSPISIDSDTNSDTLFFNIASNSITNSYLATMADNTVKVGTGSTNTNNTPQDLAIGTNSILGRVGNGDLKSVNMTELSAMLGTTQFLQVQTDDSGTLLPSESTTIRLKGGAGIVTSIGTNNEIIITNTGGGGGGGIGAVSTSGGGLITGSFTKLTFNDQDFKYTLSTADSGATAVISSGLNWGSISGGSAGAGPGLIFGSGVKNANNSSLATKLVQVGNSKQNSQLPFISVPSDGSTSSSLSYIGREATGQTTVIDRVVGFDSSGNLVATDKFVSGLTFDNTKITGLSASVASGQITISVPTDGIVKFPNLSSTNGFYFGESNNLGLVMDDNGTNGQSDFIFATADLDSSYSSSFTSGTYITSINLGGAGLSTSSGGTQTVRPTSTTIKTRYFGDNGGWTNISGTSLPRICMPGAGFMIGEGPTTSTSSLSTGMYLRTDTTNNALTFTNYNFTETGTARTIAKDRSTRIGLEVLNVPASGTSSQNYTGLSANTAYITHSIVPSGSTTVDQFAVPASSKKSYKYFIHAEDGSGDFFTTELVVQVKASGSAISTSNIIQYGSTTTNSTSLPTVTFSLSTSGSSLIVTLVSSSSSLSYKVLKYEI